MIFYLWSLMDPLIFPCQEYDDSAVSLVHTESLEAKTKIKPDTLPDVFKAVHFLCFGCYIYGELGFCYGVCVF